MIEGSGRETPRLALVLRVLAGLDRRLEQLERALSRRRKRRRREPIEVLVELNWRLGDEVMALPVYQALKQSDPLLRLNVRVRHPELLTFNPHVDRINPLSLHPDLLLDLRGEKPGVPRRSTLERRGGVSLGGLLPRVYLSDAERADPVAAELVGAGAPVVAVHAGATQPCKQWGRERWRAVARALAADGVSVLEIGASREPLGVGRDLIGRTPGIRELARVLARVDLVLGDDSGPLHLALAVGTPAIGVFGATDPRLLYPPTPAFVALASPSGCRFCWPRRRLAYPSGDCPLARHECMDAVDVAEVLAAARARLAAGSRVEA